MIKDFNDYTKIITGYEPYSYQKKVSELLLAGKNVILSVPTGAGKTWAATLPFLYAKEIGLENFPQKMIYSLPLRTLANSVYCDVNQALEKVDFGKNSTSIQTGEYKNDEHFESDIVFSTIDQTLSNFLCFPLSLSKRQANVNAGALVGSYLVFDEFHLLDPKLSMATTLGTLKTLGNLCRFCLMTATLSENYINELKNTLNAEVVTLEDFPRDISTIKSLKIPEGKDYKKSIRVKEETINTDSILQKHKKKTIIICNRVEKVQKLYNNIIASNLPGLNKQNVVCLHSRFFDEDRKRKEEKLKLLFGKGNNESAILISTQVIEAGMDISCDMMHIEISPINSLLQRAGRCARWESEFGEIFIYDILDLEERELLNLATDNDLEQSQIRAINNKYLPYDSKLCESTLEHLKTISHLDKDISQKLVDKILTKTELSDYELILQGNFNRSKIRESWETCEKNMYSQTIRDIQSIEIAIIDAEKEKDISFIPFKYQTINLYKWSFIKWAKEILAQKDIDDNDVIFIAEKESESTIIDFDVIDQDGYRLKSVRDIEPLKNHFETIFVDKSIFRYTSGAGLELGNGNCCSPIKPRKEKDQGVVEYKKDTFYQHNKAIINCYEREFKPNLRFVFKQLDEYWGETIDWDKLIIAMICLHDYGKLNKEWQKKMKLLQKLKTNGNYNPDEVLAHSDFNGVTDKEIEKQSGVKSKPPHAGVGAFALIDKAEEIIDSDDFENLSNSVATAILKHHGVETQSYPDFNIDNKEYQQTNILLNEIGIKADLIKKARGGKMSNYLPTNEEEWVIYFLLVRILRLCDQRATIDFEKYLKQ
ncbi:CRISPR-associated helicase Cas3' [Labilibaculum euxinus]